MLGGTIVAANQHLFMADTQSPASRADWRTMLAQIETLEPATVVPGHYNLDPDGSEPRSLASVSFTRDYLDAFAVKAARSAGSPDLISAMKVRYPVLAGESMLEISAKVLKEEIKWPAH